MENDDGELTYAGRVGTGFSEADLTKLRKELDKITRKTPPIDDVPREDSCEATWVTRSFTRKSSTQASPATTASVNQPGGK